MKDHKHWFKLPEKKSILKNSRMDYKKKLVDKKMKVEEVMNDEVIVMQDNEQVGHARNLMLKHGFSRIVVDSMKRENQ